MDKAFKVGLRQSAQDGLWAKISKKGSKTDQLPKNADYRLIYEPTFFTAG